MFIYNFDPAQMRRVVPKTEYVFATNGDQTFIVERQTTYFEVADPWGGPTLLVRADEEIELTKETNESTT